MILKKNNFLPFSLFFVLTLSFLFSSCSAKKTENILSFNAMDTFMTVRSFGRNSKKANLEVKNRILQIEKQISSEDENSALWKINHSEKFPVKMSADLKQIAVFSEEMAVKTNGAFNPCLYPLKEAWGFVSKNYRVPSKTELENLLPLFDWTKIKFPSNDEIFLDKNMMLDFGASGKGYAGDEAIKILKSYGIESAVLDLGGNIQLVGAKTLSGGKKTDWNVGIKNPLKKNDVAILLKIQDMAVVTSGGYERFFETENGEKYIHIFDGKTGLPVQNEILSVTVVAQSGLYADCLSTALFVMGKEKSVEFWKNLPETEQNFDFIILCSDGSLCFTSGLEGKLFPLEEFSSKEVILRK